jgi:aspartyl protease
MGAPFGRQALEMSMTAAALIVAAAISFPHIPTPKAPAFLHKKLPVPHLGIRKHDWAKADQHGEPLTVVDFDWQGRLMLAPVHINDKGPFLFAIDTAASRSVVDARVVKKLKLRTRTVPGPDGATPVTALWGSNLHVEDANIFAPQAYVADLNKGAAAKQKLRVQGILGSELFSGYVVRFDPDRKQMRIYDPWAFKPTTGATPIPLTKRNGKLYVTMTIASASGQPMQREARVDTGSDVMVSDAPAATGAPTAQLLVRDSTGKASYAPGAQLRTVQVGPYALYNVWGAAEGEPAIGMELLRRFVVTFDVAHSRMYLEPTHRSWEPSPAPATATPAS